jgi:hypothetical protein
LNTKVTIRLVRDGYGRTVVGPAAVFVAFGKTADEGLRNAERLVEARLAMQGNEGLLTR